MLQQTKAKGDTVYEKEPYKIIGINGSMISIKRGNKEYARNASLLKTFVGPRFIRDDANDSLDSLARGYQRMREEHLAEQLARANLSEQRQIQQQPQNQQQQQRHKEPVPQIGERRSQRQKKQPERNGLNTIIELENQEPLENEIFQDVTLLLD